MEKSNTVKIVIAIVCFLIAGFILQWTGFDEELGGDQSERTITLLRFLYSAVPALGLAAAILCIWRFPIDETKANEIRNRLRERKAGS